jgi:hypothetical protein
MQFSLLSTLDLLPRYCWNLNHFLTILFLLPTTKEYAYSYHSNFTNLLLYFFPIKTIRPGEEKEYYFIRLNEYEKESDISIDEMTQTMIDMKKAAELKVSFLSFSFSFIHTYFTRFFLSTLFCLCTLSIYNILNSEIHY